jgi:PAS domain-containing protein
MAAQRWIITNSYDGDPAPAQPIEVLAQSAAAILGDASSRDEGARQLKQFDPFPAPVYATDDEGWIIYYNQACVDFAGRVPTPGRDRWSVTWKLEHEDGSPLPHDRCPMAVAVQQGKPVRGAVAVARLPDGESRRFRPFPTPALHEGRLVGAINVLVPTDGRLCRDLSATASKCRDLARWVGDQRARDTLNHMASECEQQAAILRLD